MFIRSTLLNSAQETRLQNSRTIAREKLSLFTKNPSNDSYNTFSEANEKLIKTTDEIQQEIFHMNFTRPGCSKEAAPRFFGEDFYPERGGVLGFFGKEFFTLHRFRNFLKDTQNVQKKFQKEFRNIKNKSHEKCDYTFPEPVTTRVYKHVDSLWTRTGIETTAIYFISIVAIAQLAFKRDR